MSNRSTRAGSTIQLRARFRDDLGDPADAGSVFVHIYEPNKDITDIADAFVVSGIPTLLGQGIFEYSFDIPTCGPEGTWRDVWQGDLTCQSIENALAFTVVASGYIEQLEQQIFQNDVVEVTIGSGISDLSGIFFLEDPYEFEFMTTSNPAYANLRKIRIEIGGFIQGIPDATIQTSILETSIEAEAVTFAPGRINNKIYNHARREYVACATANSLLSNLASGAIKSKTLGDLSVQYNTKALFEALNRTRDCMDKWLPQLLAGGGAKTATQPSYVIKGERDPDRPLSSRMWESTNSNSIPSANDRVISNGQRRAKRTHSLHTSKKKWW